VYIIGKDSGEIQDERVKALNSKTIRKGDYVVYWMQAAQRVEYNQALEYAILTANSRSLPLIVYFGLTANFPEANARHYYFMLEGLQEVKAALKSRGIAMVIRSESPVEGMINIAKKAAVVIVDRGYLRIQREWRERAAERLECALIQVESEVIVPVEEASIKEEFSAATMRPKITAKLARYLRPLEEQAVKTKLSSPILDSSEIGDIGKTLSGLKIDGSVPKTEAFRGGTSQAKDRLNEFLDNKLEKYAEKRNDPNWDATSNLSPYLHFGQISPLYIALKVLDRGSTYSQVFLEELVIRRELAVNYTYYNPHYDAFEGIPEWCKKTLLQHSNDRREYLYNLADFEKATTHDKYWNAAQNEMRLTGKMHGYMRMYWGKKIIEWSRTPQEAFAIALKLNNKFELDGRDPNGFTGIGWCFGKHDRPWSERAIFGNIRYMNAAGLKRKFNADQYAAKFDPKQVPPSGY
jgi:deoxyribodipyrimidine photo-lyase